MCKKGTDKQLCWFACVYVFICVHSVYLFENGGGASDKLPHLSCFKRSERSHGEAFIAEMEERDRIKKEWVWKKMKRGVRG